MLASASHQQSGQERVSRLEGRELNLEPYLLTLLRDNLKALKPDPHTFWLNSFRSYVQTKEHITVIQQQQQLQQQQLQQNQ